MLGSFSNFVDPFWFITIPMGIIGWCIALVASILNSIEDSSRFPVFSWWGIAFEGIVILSIIYIVWSNRVKQYRLALLAFLAIATVYTSNSTNNFVWRNNVTSSATAAGNILLSIINLFWILYFGTTQDEPIHHFVDSFASQKKPVRGRAALSKYHDSENQVHVASTTGGPSLPPNSIVRRNNTNSGMGMSRSMAGSGHPVQRSTEFRSYRPSQTQSRGHHGTNDPMTPERQTATNPAETRFNSGSYPQQYGTSNAGMGIFSEQLYPIDDGRFSHMYGSDDTNVTEKEGGLLDNPFLYRARAKYSYIAKANEGEISFVRGEVLEVSDMTSKWWVCRNAEGEVGICPNNYLETITREQADALLAKTEHRHEHSTDPNEYTNPIATPSREDADSRLHNERPTTPQTTYPQHIEDPTADDDFLDRSTRPSDDIDGAHRNLLSLI